MTTLNAADAIKPGATVLLTGTDESRRERPVLAFQRYGRGKTFALTLQDSWLWQMHAAIDVNDTGQVVGDSDLGFDETPPPLPCTHFRRRQRAG